MIDLNDYRKRLTILSDGLTLTADDEGPDGDYALFVDHLREAFASTPVADLREVSRGLGFAAPFRARDAVICGIAYSWANLDPEQRTYVEDADGAGTGPDVAVRLDDLAATMRSLTDAFSVEQVERLREGLAAIEAAVRDVNRGSRSSG